MRFSALIIIIFLTLWVNAQMESPYRKFNTLNGLKSNTIYDLLEDEQGRVFIGHEAGLSYFDGLNFIHPENAGVQEPISNMRAINNQEILGWSFDGSAFVLKGNKISSIKHRLNETRPYMNYLNNSGPPIGIIGKHIYQLMGDSVFLPIEMKAWPELRGLSSICIFGNQFILAYTTKLGNQILLGDLNTKEVTQIRPVQDIPSRRFFSFKGEVFEISTSAYALNRLNTLNLNREEMTFPAILKNQKITQIKETRDGKLLIGSFSGAYLFDQNFNLIRHFFKGYQISAALEDKEGNLWFGTLQDGLLIIPFPHLKLIDISSIRGENLRISTSSSLNDTALLLGSYNGKLIWVNANGQIERITNFNRATEVQSIYFDKLKNEIHVYCGKLVVLDAKSGRIKSELEMRPVKCEIGMAGTSVFGTSSGLILYENNQQKIYADSFWITQLLKLNNNQFLLESQYGIYQFSLDSKQIRRLELGSQVSSDLCNYDGKICFRQGDSIFSLVDSKKVFLFKNNGAKLNKIFGSNKRLFLYTDDGQLQWADQSNSYFLNETKGLFQKEIKAVYYQSSTIISVDAAGVQYFPEERRINSIQPMLMLLETKGSFEKQDGIWVSEFKNNKLDIPFRILPNIKGYKYSRIFYRVQGLDSSWNSLHQNSGYRLTLERIPYGTYTLEAFASNEDSISSPIYKMPFKIFKPFYLQSWFIISVLVLFAILIFILFRWRLWLNNKRNIERLETEKLKIRALHAELQAIRSQMNPHFIFNSLSSIQTKILNQNSVEAYQDLSTFSKLLRQALQFSAKEFISLEDELDFLNNYIKLELLRSKDGFHFEQNIDTQINPELEEFPSLLLQPFVENAIRHGLHHQEGIKKLSLEIKAINQGYSIRIEDTGIGREASERINKQSRNRHESFATKAIADRVDMINKGNYPILLKISIQDLEPGTSVYIEVIKRETDT